MMRFKYLFGFLMLAPEFIPKAKFNGIEPT